ncbi:MAG: DUF983 domain-containing protein [Hyphomicrobiales bacterium]|nr:DUF983 domain-containing protein [Hyphomicrobiales bacterium]
MVSPWKAGFSLKCPACGKGKLYRGLLKVADCCEICQFPIKDHDAGDAPAYISLFLIAILASIILFVIEIVYEPPLWVHFVIQGGFIIGGSVRCLVYAKALMIAFDMKYNPSRKQD